jgi:hypothetical protein
MIQNLNVLESNCHILQHTHVYRCIWPYISGMGGKKTIYSNLPLAYIQKKLLILEHKNVINTILKKWQQ